MKNILMIAMLLASGWVVSSPAVHPEPTLSEHEVDTIIANTVTALHDTYLFPEQVSDAVSQLRYERSMGMFQRGMKFGRFRQRYEALLITATQDSGFELLERTPATLQSSAPEHQRTSNLAMEILPDNIGYLTFEGDFTGAGADRELAAAMHYVRDTGALILDLRRAGETSFAVAQNVVSQFVKTGTELARVDYNSPHSPSVVRAQSVPAPYLARPVYILTAALVAGPWEFVCYTLKHHDTAVIIGEDTMGVGYMKMAIDLSEHARLTLYYAQTRHPETEGNWHRIGVIADYQTSAADSMDTALTLISDAL
ncbi:S41 family peptidase [Alteromonas sp. ASW11-19]|uniref:S41 family peptidase n=1 Tax=Alteromonas salexigens TaxID=2982530 RepID=A0ABT2VS54_9ALTE|nr:S41 family peptidase [Alteromonas salexigens]MCU7554729.1 S41 family peptidase [Alteromonas salexigens]